MEILAIVGSSVTSSAVLAEAVSSSVFPSVVAVGIMVILWLGPGLAITPWFFMRHREERSWAWLAAAPVVSFAAYAVIGTTMYRLGDLSNPSTVLLCVALLASVSAFGLARRRHQMVGRRVHRPLEVGGPRIATAMLILAVIVIPALHSYASVTRSRGYAVYVLNQSGVIGSPARLVSAGTAMHIAVRIDNYAKSRRAFTVGLQTPWASTSRRVVVDGGSEFALGLPVEVPLYARGPFKVEVLVVCKSGVYHCNRKILDLHFAAANAGNR